MKMLIEGGYDPYSEYNIAVSPIFLQRNVESFKILMNISYHFIKKYENLCFLSENH